MTTPPTNPIVTAAIGNNGQIFPNILELYSNELDMIADVTYGMGRFWRNVDVEKYFFYHQTSLRGSTTTIFRTKMV